MSKRTERAGHQLELEAEIGQSHLPDLTERLIECHRILQMSREYITDHVDHATPALQDAYSELGGAMIGIEHAIAKLTEL